MKAIIFARVSSKEQEEGHSIAAQVQRLQEYCQRRGMDVIRTFELVESSTRGERKEFQAILEFAGKQCETVAVVADAVDRIQRGFKESIVLAELVDKGTIELHFTRENMVIGINASAMDKIRWDYSVIGAKSYVLNLSENVKRSIHYKLKNGEWIGPAPVGYLNERDPKTNKATLIIDPVRGPLVRRIFEEYASGAYSINEMAKRAKGWGLRNKTTKAGTLSTSQVHDLLRNPFYHGEMRVLGCLYPHRYPPLISRELFHQCEDIRTSRSRLGAVKQTKHPFVFRGLVKCGVSARKVTCDLKKGKYVYMICRDPENPDKKLFVPESSALKQVEQVLKRMVLPESLVQALADHLKQSHEAEMEFHHQAIKTLERENEALQEKMDRLLDLMIDGSITRDIHDTKLQSLKQRQYEINQELKAHHLADNSYRITVTSLISLASRAHACSKVRKTPKNGT